MRGSSKLTSARTRRWHGAWRPRRRRVLRPPLRLLRFLIVVLSLERGMVGRISRMMLPPLDLQSSQLPQVA